MSTYLLDANVLIAFLHPEHLHHEPSRRWFLGLDPGDRVAIDPVVEGALVRFGLRIGARGAAVQAALREIRERPDWVGLPDDLPYTELDLSTVRGYRQVTDTYLAALATRHGAVLVTFDRALAARLPESTLLLKL
ncbi:PIN domain-containing protein [Actinomyces oricola]